MRWIYGLVMLAVLAAPLMADTIDSVFIVSQETNDKVTTIAQEQQKMATGIGDLGNRVSAVEYAVNGMSQDYMLTQAISCVFTAFLTAFLTLRFVATKFVEGLRETQAVPSPQPTPAAVPAPAPAPAPVPEYDIVTEYYCRKCSQKYTDTVKFCPLDGNKVSVRTEKVPRALQQRANAQAQQLSQRVKRPLWKRLLRLG